jgi:hypothetical protein
MSDACSIRRHRSCFPDRAAACFCCPVRQMWHPERIADSNADSLRTQTPQQNLQAQSISPAAYWATEASNRPAGCSAGDRASASSSATSPPPPAAAAPTSPRCLTFRTPRHPHHRRWRRRSPSPCRRTGGRGATRTTGCATPPTLTWPLCSLLRTPTQTPSSARPAAAASARVSRPRCVRGCPLPS